MWSFNFNTILNTCFKYLFRKTEKIADFTLRNKPLEPYKLPWKIVLYQKEDTSKTDNFVDKPGTLFFDNEKIC